MQCSFVGHYGEPDLSFNVPLIEDGAVLVTPAPAAPAGLASVTVLASDSEPETLASATSGSHGASAGSGCGDATGTLTAGSSSAPPVTLHRYLYNPLLGTWASRNY